MRILPVRNYQTNDNKQNVNFGAFYVKQTLKVRIPDGIMERMLSHWKKEPVFHFDALRLPGEDLVEFQKRFPNHHSMYFNLHEWLDITQADSPLKQATFHAAKAEEITDEKVLSYFI